MPNLMGSFNLLWDIQVISVGFTEVSLLQVPCLQGSPSLASGDPK